MSYQVNGDDLFSDDDDDYVATPSPKRLRPTPTPQPQSQPPPQLARKAPRLGPISLTGFGGSANLSGAPVRPSRPNPRPNPRSNPPANSSRYNQPTSHYQQRSSLRGLSNAEPPTHNYRDNRLRPLGRGIAATLPAHITERRQTNDREPSITRTAGTTAQLERIKEAASILPAHIRDKVVQQQLEKEQKAQTERKRPTRRIKRQKPADEQPSKAVLENLKRSRTAAPAFGLQQLLSEAQKSSSLIQLDPDRNKIHKTKRFTPESEIYKKVSMTKEMREREEREKRQEEEKKEKERLREETYFRELRDEARSNRRKLSQAWRRTPTVASEMRQCYRLAREERRLFSAPDDKKRLDNLEYLGLKRHPVEEDERVTKMLHIELVEI